MILGDLNSRVGNLQDFVVDDNYTLRNQNLLPEEYTTDMFLPKKSEDSVVNTNGRLLIDFLTETGLRIANGRIGSDQNIGAFTFVGANGSSVVDYCIVDEVLLTKFVNFNVHGPNVLSDHCLIEFALESRQIYMKI